MSAEDGEKVEVESGVCYRYAIPLEEVKGVSKPAYDPAIKGGLHMYHYGSKKLYIIQGKAAGHFHKDNVNVSVRELDKEEVENCDNLVDEYV